MVARRLRAGKRFDGLDRLAVYCRPVEKNAWISEAKRNGLALNDWAKGILNAALSEPPRSTLWEE